MERVDQPFWMKSESVVKAEIGERKGKLKKEDEEERGEGRESQKKGKKSDKLETVGLG